MLKIALFFSVLLFVPIISGQSFAYFGGDMHEQNSLSFSFDKIKKTSDILTISQLDNGETLKRYIVFGHG